MARSTRHPPLPELLQILVIPTTFKKHQDAAPNEKAILDEWAKHAIPALGQVKVLLQELRGDLELDELGNTVARVAPFVYDPASLNDLDEYRAHKEERNVLENEAPWVALGAKQLAQDILEELGPRQDEKIVQHVLDRVVKPVFRASNPHPHLNPLTGKSLSQSQIRRAPQQGGLSSITQDFFEVEGQRWKSSVGLEAVLYWCIDHIQPSLYDKVWHLVVPPLMTLLDDYEPRYKLWGLLIAQRMLRDVPPSLLKKTGIHGLLETSFKKILAHQDSPLSPTILRLAISQSLRLLVSTTNEGTKARFDALCGLLGEGVITTVWTYTFDKPQVVRATLDALPPVIKTLDIGCARFLQSLMPQLIHPLVLPSKQGPVPGHPSVDLLQLQLQLSSLRVLIPLMEACAPRVHGWRLTILDALVRCWAVVLTDHADDIVSPFAFLPPTLQGDSDSDGDEEESREPAAQRYHVDAQAVRPTDPSNINDDLECLKCLLQMACYQLVKVCPSLATNEYPFLVQTDSGLLKGLLPRLQTLNT